MEAHKVIAQAADETSHMKRGCAACHILAMPALMMWRIMPTAMVKEKSEGGVAKQQWW